MKLGLLQIRKVTLSQDTALVWRGIFNNVSTATKVWFYYRKGLITASHFHEVLHHKWVSYPTSIVKSIMQYQLPNPNIPALKWGRDK